MAIGFPTSLETFEFLARFLISGFIIFLIRNAYVVGERPKISELALDLALFSLINQLVFRLFAWAALWIHGAIIRVSNTPTKWETFSFGPDVAFFLEVICLPVIIGILSGNALAKGWFSGPFRALSIPVVDPLPRAYDHVFSQRGTSFVILTFRSGEIVYGYYGPNSRAGRDPARSEIYLERLYIVNSIGQWTETSPPRSALINLTDLRSIEFIEQT
jgi:Family of unknown function (DUF6338)